MEDQAIDLERVLRHALGEYNHPTSPGRGVVVQQDMARAAARAMFSLVTMVTMSGYHGHQPEVIELELE